MKLESTILSQSTYSFYKILLIQFQEYIKIIFVL